MIRNQYSSNIVDDKYIRRPQPGHQRHSSGPCIASQSMPSVDTASVTPGEKVSPTRSRPGRRGEKTSSSEYEKIDTSSLEVPDSRGHATGPAMSPLAGDQAENGSSCERSQTPTSEKGKPTGSTSKKKKLSQWLNMTGTVLNPTYKSRSDDFKKLFKEIPNEERLIADHSCALQKDFLVQGRMYITQKWICFYANIFSWETVLTIPCEQITALTKERTARLIPNALQIATDTDKYFFTTFTSREKAFVMCFRIWQNALLAQPMMPSEMWQWIHLSYGSNLGLHSSDDDYVAPSVGDPSLDFDERGDVREAESVENSETIREQEEEEEQEALETRGRRNDDVSQASKGGAGDRGLPMMASFDGDEVPTDVTDNSESEDTGTSDSDVAGEHAGQQTPPVPVFRPAECEVSCGCEKHPTEYMNEALPVGVDRLFDLLFGDDSSFYKDFLTRRTIPDSQLVYPAWPQNSDKDGRRSRDLSYTLALSHPLGPKCSPVTEKQVMFSQSSPGLMYIVECHCHNSGIPYSDSFYVANRYCLTKVSANKSRLAVHSEIKYKKNVWGLAKGFIERNCIQGIQDYYNDLAIPLHQECSVGHQPITSLNKDCHRKKVLRRRRGHSIREDKVATPGVSISEACPIKQLPVPKVMVHHKSVIPLNIDVIVRAMCVVLLLLVLLNAVLFYKLWHLEDVASQVYSSHQPKGHHHGYNKEFTIANPPKSTSEWMELLKKQHLHHQGELERWRVVLSTSMLFVDQMKVTLSELLRSIRANTDDVSQPPRVAGDEKDIASENSR